MKNKKNNIFIPFLIRHSIPKPTTAKAQAMDVQTYRDFYEADVVSSDDLSSDYLAQKIQNKLDDRNAKPAPYVFVGNDAAHAIALLKQCVAWKHPDRFLLVEMNVDRQALCFIKDSRGHKHLALRAETKIEPDDIKKCYREKDVWWPLAERPQWANQIHKNDYICSVQFHDDDYMTHFIFNTHEPKKEPAPMHESIISISAFLSNVDFWKHQKNMFMRLLKPTFPEGIVEMKRECEQPMSNTHDLLTRLQRVAARHYREEGSAESLFNSSFANKWYQQVLLANDLNSLAEALVISHPECLTNLSATPHQNGY